MALCTQACQSEGYILADVEYFGECYYGNAISNGGGSAPYGLTERWYPMAMVTANGSILVVGGKNGSNGAPVPNLEIVPKSPDAGLVYCDWLNRTDPTISILPWQSCLPAVPLSHITTKQE